eukprot:TRINITY_DN31204_c0_g1_i1.p1 TRINITY_DN31204_c0_g1~~TRINITY_DN31204_c0_g1_i1.p1  ORF type:complete len:275 (+),score=41.49 TRINITY_DN31204_c0_g1_i1:85-909(+)
MSEPVKKVMIIAGSDSGGGAGIQADIKTCEAHAVYSMTAVTAITAQNTVGVHSASKVDTEMLKKQIEVCRDDIGWDAVKIGMLPDAAAVEAVSQILSSHKSVVTDPVMVATSGDRLVTDEAMQAMKNHLFPISEIITPNILEALAILGEPDMTVSSAEDMKVVAKRLHAICKTPHILVKGGHLMGPRQSECPDVLYSSATDSCSVFSTAFIDTKNTHGTGCTLSSSIASNLALGHSVLKSVELSKQYLHTTLSRSANIVIGGGKQGPMLHRLGR